MITLSLHICLLQPCNFQRSTAGCSEQNNEVSRGTGILRAPLVYLLPVFVSEGQNLLARLGLQRVALQRRVLDLSPRVSELFVFVAIDSECP